MDKQKFEKCIRLTESENDHEALSALRTAQKICHKNKFNFVDFLLKSKQNTDFSSECDYLKARLASSIRRNDELEKRCEELYKETTKLKKKIESKKGSKSLQKKYR